MTIIVMPSGVVIYVYIHHSLSLPTSYSLFCVLLAMYISPFPIVSERTPLYTLFVVFLQTPQLYFSRPFFTSLCLLLHYPHPIKFGCESTPLPLSSPLTSCYLLRPALFSAKYTWMAAVCHEIKETVSLERCKCGERYEQWGRRPAPPCSKCEKIHVRKASSGKTGTEQGGSEGKRAKCDSSNGIGERKREKIQHPWKAVKKIKNTS